MSGRLGALVVAVLVLSTVVLVAAFAGGGGDGGGSGAAAPPLASMDGVLVEVREDRLMLQPFGQGAQPQRLLVQPRDVAVLDLPHLRQHVQDGTPVRLFYERSGGGLVARSYQDLLGG